jgi:hypothetical protein
MPLAIKIIFTVVLAVSVVSSFFKNFAFADDCADDSKHWTDNDYNAWIALTFVAWVWRIALIVSLWVF